jgi:hypothetical protein
MTWDYFNQTLDDLIDYEEPRETRLQTPQKQTTSHLREPVYLGRHEEDDKTITALADDVDDLADVHARITYDERIDAITVTPYDDITVIRHGTNYKPAPQVKHAHAKTPRPGLTTNQTYHVIEQRRPGIVIEGTTKLAHPEHGHELSISHEPAYQAMKRYQDTDYDVDVTSSQPRVDAANPDNAVTINYEEN